MMWMQKESMTILREIVEREEHARLICEYLQTYKIDSEQPVIELIEAIEAILTAKRTMLSNSLIFELDKQPLETDV